MKHTIFLKILLGFLIINFILILSVSIISYQIIKSHYLDTLRDYLLHTGRMLTINIKPFLLDQKFEDLDIYVKEIGRGNDFRVTIITPQGLVVADSERNVQEMDDHGDRPEFISALYGDSGESIRFSISVQADMLYKAIPIIEDDKVIGVLRVSLFLDRIDILIQSLRREIFYIGLTVFLLAFIGLYIFTYRLTKPIRELSRAAEKVSNGDFSVNVYSRSNDDIGYLCRNFNYMVTRIRELIDEITRSKDSLATIINTMQEGLLVLNDKGQIEFANKSFESISDSDHYDNKYYWEGIRKPQICEFIRELFESKKELYRELTIDSEYYICSGLFLPNKKERLILLYNITELRRLDKIKKDIVANVSHELRSPLTAVKGFSETLEDQVTPEGLEYLKIINRNIDRLISIVNDLLTLSQLEQKDNIDLQTMQINDVVNHIAHIYQEKAAKKNLQLMIEIDPALPQIKGDEFRLEQILVNLLENSLQYTEQGFIKISTKREDRFILIKVEDSGIGIPYEHRERIFERFYVVDKSRVKKYGGTGLGLAIVKHIALLHNGSVNLENREGPGSCFVVRLPVEKSRI